MKEGRMAEPKGEALNEWEAFLEAVKGAARGGIAEEAPCRWFKAERCSKCTVKAAGHDDCMEAMLLDVALVAGEIGMRSVTTRRLAQMLKNPKDPRHGTHYGYVNGCRCERCVEANRRQMREYRKRRACSNT